jgi:uncharacterized protein YccT (UPF0319 family)
VVLRRPRHDGRAGVLHRDNRTAVGAPVVIEAYTHLDRHVLARFRRARQAAEGEEVTLFDLRDKSGSELRARLDELKAERDHFMSRVMPEVEAISAELGRRAQETWDQICQRKEDRR